MYLGMAQAKWLLRPRGSIPHIQICRMKNVALLFPWFLLFFLAPHQWEGNFDHGTLVVAYREKKERIDARSSIPGFLPGGARTPNQIRLGEAATLPIFFCSKQSLVLDQCVNGIKRIRVVFFSFI